MCSDTTFNSLCNIYFILLIFLGLFIEAADSNRLPVFNREILVKSIKEEEPQGTFVLRTTAVDADGEDIGYSLIGDPTGFFRIDNITGDLTTDKVIDREMLISNQIQFKIAAFELKNPNQRSLQDVKIHIIDINDNVPQFDQKQYSINVSENTQRNDYVGVVKATDNDQNPELLFTIVSGDKDGCFEIDTYTGQIKTAKQLDYEKQKRYVLKVLVTDGRPTDSSRHTTYTTVIINLIDVDDNGAKFQSNYSAVITEGNHKEEVVCHIYAYDQDKGINAPVMYSIDQTTNLDGIFSVDQSGYVYVNGIVDRERHPFYKIKLLATEITATLKKHPPAETFLRIKVEDLNDNKPEFERKTYIGRVKEHQSYGHIVVTVVAKDKDTGKNGLFEYRLEGEEGVFGINQKGEIFVQDDLDREKKYVYEFKVLAIEDGFTRPASSQVTIIVDDENDHDPVFNKDEYTASVKENKLAGVFVALVTAVDRDKGENARIKYSIIPDAEETSKCFYINPDSGEMKTMCSLDREKKQFYSLLIRASDNGNIETRRYDDTVVKVTVLDENDNHPVFKEREYFKSLHYDVSINTPVVQLEAIDSDIGAYGQVSYRIIDGNQQNRFHIDKATGQLKVAEALAASSGQFTIKIEAYDNIGLEPTLSTKDSATVVITIDQLGGDSVVIVLKAMLKNILKHEDKIISDLKSVLGIGIVIDKIEKGNTLDTTHIVFHGYDERSFVVVDKKEIIKVLDNSFDDKLKNLKSTWNVTSWYELKVMERLQSQSDNDDDSANSDRWSPIIYAVLGFSAIIILFGMIGIIYLIRSKRRAYDDAAISLASSRIPIATRKATGSFWHDDGFESVSQVGQPHNYVHGFLDQSYDRYELDPSNMYTQRSLGEEDPFNRALSNRSPSRNSLSSRASSIFAASSVMTVYKSPHSESLLNNQQPDNKFKNYLPRNSLPRKPKPLSKERKLSVIVDVDGNPTSVIDLEDHHENEPLKRPPSYEYDLDEITNEKLA